MHKAKQVKILEGNWRRLRILLSRSDPRFTDFIREALEDEDETVQSTAVWALGTSGDKRAVEPLKEIS